MNRAYRKGGKRMKYEDLIGTPFIDGGRDKEIGLDCWGLAREMFRRQGIDVPDYQISAMRTAEIAREMTAEEMDWTRLEAPEKGCLVLLRLDPEVWANHVGIYLGGGKFIHAYRATGVCIDRLTRWRSRIVGFYQPKGAEK